MFFLKYEEYNFVSLAVANALAIGAVADFKALNCLPAMNLILSTNLHLTTETPITCRCC